ncbi:MAG: universal stress protein [Alphaproteobacteria bacterium]|nr:universal stress protein [Alphaproteobacteria bacterium]
MFKDILVHIPSERATGPIIDGSVSLAARFNACLTAISIGYVSSAAHIIGISESGRERAAERTGAALAGFEEEAKKAGISYSCESILASPGEAEKAITGTSRLFDLSVVLQPDSEENTHDNRIPAEILFHSGGPVLFVPHIFRGTLDARRVGLCWDGSRIAARAFHDARPLLSRAESVAIITVNHADEGHAAADHLARHFARVGTQARSIALTAARSDIQPALLSLAADENLDLLVMGGYGHSRLQENFLGGVTRAMLESMTVPTLMSH